MNQTTGWLGRRWRRPVQPWAWATGLGVAVAGGALFGRDVANSAIADWPTVSSSLREGVTFVGPLAGALALAYARSIYGRNSLLVGPWSTRPPSTTVSRILAGLGVPIASGYLVGYTVALVDAARRATAGTADLLVMTGGLLSLLLFVGLGLGLATFPGNRLAPVIGIFLLIGVAGAGTSGQLLSLLPTWGGSFVSSGYRENPLLGWFRILWLVALLVALVLFAGRRIDSRGAPSAWRWLRDAAPLLALVPFIVWGASRPIDPIIPELNPPLACNSTTGVVVCVHRARMALLNDLSAIVSRQTGVFGGLEPFGVDGVYDYLIVPFPERKPTVVPVQLLYDHENWQAQTATDLATLLVGRHCVIDISSEDDLVRSYVNNGIGLWLYNAAGYDTPAAVAWGTSSGADPVETADLAAASGDHVSTAFWRLEALSDEGARTWIAENIDRIQSCDIRPQDLP